MSKTSQKKKFNSPVDLVYLWVDGSDEEWIKKKHYYLSGSDTEYKQEAIDICRAKDNDELKYSLRLVEKYIPWINKIFIVTDNQIPKWLDTSNPKIKVVFHEDFIPEDVLPLFNSAEIELYLHKIPELSEHFLYANDDMFINSPLSPEFFFTPDGKPIVRMQKSMCKKLADKSVYSFTILKMQQLIGEKFSKFFNLEPHHNIDAYCKSICSECENIFKDKYFKNNKFRKPEDTQRSLISFYAMATNQAELRIIPRTDFHLPFGTTLFNKLTGRYGVDSKYIGIEKSILEKRFYYVNPKLFCFNDSDRATELNRINAKRFLRKLIPSRSSFEKENNKIFISIVVPVYNIESCLNKCLDSLLNQTLNNIEIICVNDGSTDRSLNILKEYADKDSRIKIINQENSGVSVARNNGIKAAQGEYILFVDSDDWLELNACEKLYEEADITQSDVIIFSHYNVFPNKKKIYDLSNDCLKTVLKYNNIDEYIKNIIYVPGVVWNKLYKKEFIEKFNLSFMPGLSQSEDLLFWFDAVYNKPQISVLNIPLYNYLNIRDDSVLNNFEKSFSKYSNSHELIKNSKLFIGASPEGKMYLTDRDMNYFCWMWIKHKNEREKIYSGIQNYLSEYNNFDIKKIKHLKNYKKLQKIIKSYKNRHFNSFLSSIFSIKNDVKRENKIVTFLGLQYKFVITHKRMI